MKAQRQYTRHSIKSIDMKGKTSFDAEAKLLNISLDGACISTNKQLDIGNEYELHLESTKNTMTVKGVIVWERLRELQINEQNGTEVPLYEVGMRFCDILTEKGTRILNFIDESSVSKYIKSRLREVRVKVLKPDMSTTMDNYKNHTVVNLSFGGMHIEFEGKMETESTFEMEINIPKSNQPIKFLGRVASSAEITDVIPRRYDTGIEFIKMSDGDKDRLNKFINLFQGL